MSINDIIDNLSVAEASEILCRLGEAEINVSVPECNKDVAEENLEEVCNIYLSEPVYYDSNVSDILYEHIYDELVDIIFDLSAKNLQRVINSEIAGDEHTNLKDILRNYSEVYSENLIGKKITRVLLLRWLITDIKAEICTLCGRVVMYHPDHK